MSAMFKGKSEESYMKEALKEAEKAFASDEVPVGAIIVCDDQIIARAHNLTERLIDVTAHAEMQAFTAASDFLGSKFLQECSMYVTLEPCMMCAGASYWTRIGRIVYGAPDPKKGYRIYTDKHALHPKTIVKGGVLKEECGELLKRFFEAKR